MPVRLLRQNSVPVADEAARLALVDVALASVSQRDFLTGKEAGEMFRDLRTSFGDNAGSSTAEFLAGAVRDYTSQGLWGAPTVADTLLDLRLLATTPQAAASAP